MPRRTKVAFLAAALAACLPPAIERAAAQETIRLTPRQTPPSAQTDNVGPLLAELVAAESAADSTTEAGREAVRELRSRLIAAAEGDDRLATWLADQAAHLLRDAESDGSALSVMYGVPTTSQRDRVWRLAREALVLLARADAEASSAADALQSHIFDLGGAEPERARTEGDRVEERLRILIDAEKRGRIPLLAGRAETLAAWADTDVPSRAAAARRAADKLRALTLSTPEAEHARRVSLAAALLALVGSATGDDRASLLDAARGELDAAAGAGVATEVELCRALADAYAGSVRVVAAPEGVPPGGPLALVFAESPLRALIVAHGDGEGGEGEVDAETARAAVLPLAEMLARAVESEDAPMAALISDKVSAAAGLVPTDGLPPAATLAIARGLARSADPASADRGVAMLGSLREDPSAGAFAGPAAWELAVALSRRDDPESLITATETLNWLQRTKPPGVSRSQLAAAAMSSVELARYAATRAASGPLADRARAAWLDSLELAAGRMEGTPEAAAWNLRRAEMIIALPVENWPPEPRRVIEALPILSAAATTGESKMRAVALAGRVIDRVADWWAVDPAWAHDEQGLEAARALASWAKRHRVAGADRARLVVLRMLRAWGRLAEAADEAESLAKEASEQVAPEALLELGELQREFGDTETAFESLREAATRLEQRAPLPESFWRAWAGILEVLAADNESGDRTRVIRLHLRDLQLLDPNMGGGDASLRLLVVERAMEDAPG